MPSEEASNWIFEKLLNQDALYVLVVCSLGGTTAQKGEFSIRARRLLFTSPDPYQPDNNMMHPMVGNSLGVFTKGTQNCKISHFFEPGKM